MNLFKVIVTSFVLLCSSPIFASNAQERDVLSFFNRLHPLYLFRATTNNDAKEDVDQSSSEEQDTCMIFRRFIEAVGIAAVFNSCDCGCGIAATCCCCCFEHLLIAMQDAEKFTDGAAPNNYLGKGNSRSKMA